MRIVFITACLEPGRDGVGDYTRTLARECSRLGHSSALLSLNEHALLPGSTASAYRSGSELRLSSHTPWTSRIAQARQFLEYQQPDWISLQFVCYGWNARGICAGLAQRLSRIIVGRKLHVMFHELWIGHYPGAPLKERLIGSAQRFCVLRLLHKLEPRVVHTNIDTYVNLLAKAGVRSEKLSLFGNIPIAPVASDEWLLRELRYTGLDLTPATRQKFWLIGLFGALHPNWPPEPLLSRIRSAAHERGKQAVFISIGRIGPGKQLWQDLADAHRGQIAFLQLGERSPETISSFLQSIDFGVAGSPYSIIEKSGSTAALLEHGCPIVVNWIDPHDAPQNYDPLLHCLDAKLDFAALRRRSPASRLPAIAAQFVDRLNQSEHSVPTPAYAHEHTVRTVSQ